MERKIRRWQGAVGSLLLLFALVLAGWLLIGGSRAHAAVPPVGQHPEDTATREVTHHPEMTRTPHATNTPFRDHTPHATNTPYRDHTPYPTRTPDGDRTPHATATRNVDRTPHPTYTPGGATRTPYPTRTPYLRPAMIFRPQVLFQRALPGHNALYEMFLLNRFHEERRVNFSIRSLSDWHTEVRPETALVQPGVPLEVHAVVHVPMTPTHRIDLAGVVATSGDLRPAVAWLVTVVFRRDFSDLDETHWADGPVQYLAEEGVLTGYADGSFRPNANVTRAQFAKMVVEAMGWEVITPAQATFSDVAPDNWAYGYVETAAAHGVIGGYGDGTFRPGTDVTRAQVAKMVSNATGWDMDTGERPFRDVTNADWFATHVATVSEAEVMSGYGDGTFRPYASATRAQVAKILALAMLREE